MSKRMFIPDGTPVLVTEYYILTRRNIETLNMAVCSATNVESCLCLKVLREFPITVFYLIFYLSCRFLNKKGQIVGIAFGLFFMYPPLRRKVWEMAKLKTKEIEVRNSDDSGAAW